MKRVTAHIIRIVSIVIIVLDVWSIVEKIKWYKNPVPGLAEMINIKVDIVWLVLGGIGLVLTSLYLMRKRQI